MLGFLGLKKSSGKTKILIVDDEPDIIQTLQDRLEMNGYIVLSANNGREGLEKAVEQKPDLILLDVIMPIMDGLETLEAIRKHPEIKDCSIIMVTARSQTQDIARAKTCGIDDYVVKPFDLGELLEKVENII